MTGEPDLCSRCGMTFPPDQVCGGCVTDAERIRAAAAILRSTNGRNLIGDVFVRVLELRADRLERVQPDSLT